jgi:uncharacterized protein (TIGR03435 family)
MMEAISFRRKGLPVSISRVFFPILAASVLLAIAPVPCPAQSAAAPTASTTPTKKLAFDVATVKPAAPLDPAQMAAAMRAGKMLRIGLHIDASRAGYYYLPLKQLIAVAYGVKPYQITGPAWLDTERFDIEGTYPEGATKTDAPAMLQSLLVDRFKLTVHRTTDEHKVLALVTGKNGPKLTEATTKPEPIDESVPLKPRETQMDTQDGPVRMAMGKDGSAVVNMGTKGTLTYKFDVPERVIHMTSSNVTMAGFADTLSSLLTQFSGGTAGLVVDETGLKGLYEVAVDLSLDDMMAMARSQGFGAAPAPGPGTAGPAAASDPGGGTSIYQSVEKLGLKLEERKAPVEQLVIDHVEKTPTEN